MSIEIGAGFDFFFKNHAGVVIGIFKNGGIITALKILGFIKRIEQQGVDFGIGAAGVADFDERGDFGFEALQK